MTICRPGTRCLLAASSLQRADPQLLAGLDARHDGHAVLRGIAHPGERCRTAADRLGKVLPALAVIDLPIIGEGGGRRILVRESRPLRHRRPGRGRLHRGRACAARGPRRSSSAEFGAIEATIASAGVPSRLVQPKAWKKHHGLHWPDKEPSRQLVIPRLPQRTGFFARKLDHGPPRRC
jgi:hypothetical protein